MRLKALIDEDFTNYKKPSMFIGTISCNWKCCKEQNLDVSMCQNSALAQSDMVELANEIIVKRYKNNAITKAIVFGGLEPFDQYQEMIELISEFRRQKIYDDVVIYTGYYDYEIPKDRLQNLLGLQNIIVKFGRYIPDTDQRYDEVLGVILASDNQYAERLDGTNAN